MTDTVKSPQGVLDLFCAYGFTPPEKFAVQKWFLRGNTPGRWIAMLLALLELENGKPVSMVAYMTKGGLA